MAEQRSRRIRDPNARMRHLGKLPVEKQLKEIRNALVDMWAVVNPFFIGKDASYTTTGGAAWEVVVCTNTGSITISLHSNPKDGDQVTVKRQNTGAVTVDTAGSETIDGAASKSIASQYDFLTVVYTDAGSEWSIISA